MSAPPDYQTMYNELKKEYDQFKADNDEIMKEYESTIQMLTDSAEKLKEEKENAEKMYNDSLKKIKQNEKDLESFKNKNMDKMKDIEILNAKNDKLIQELNKVNATKAIMDSKVVTLENDNDHFMGKIREYEAQVDDLNMKLESALEENISLQTDFETYKQSAEEQLLRKDQELKDAKNEISNKEKMIIRLSKRDSLTSKTAQAHKILLENQRKMSVPINNLGVITNTLGNAASSNTGSNTIPTTTPNKKGSAKEVSSKRDGSVEKKNPATTTQEKPVKKEESTEKSTEKKKFKRGSKSQLNRTWSTPELLSIITPIVGQGQKLPEKFMEMYSRPLRQVEKDIKSKEKNEKGDKIEEEANSDDESGESDEVSGNDDKKFDIIEIENGTKLEFLSQIKPVQKKSETNVLNNDKRLTENLKEMLNRIQQRKSYLLNHKKVINEKLEKIGVKIR